MLKDLTDITLIVDRSGSMESIREDAQGGINSFIENQAALPGDARLTLVEFDTEYEFVHRGVAIREVPKYKLVPRGATALLDAVGRAILETGERLKSMPESERPGLVALVIVTDGQENSSREFNREKVRQMIAHQEQIYKWQFTFLVADANAFDDMRQLAGDHADLAQYNKDHMVSMYRAVDAKVARMRSAVFCEQPVENAFTDEERQAMQ